MCLSLVGTRMIVLYNRWNKKLPKKYGLSRRIPILQWSPVPPLPQGSQCGSQPHQDGRLNCRSKQLQDRLLGFTLSSNSTPSCQHDSQFIFLNLDFNERELQTVQRITFLSSSVVCAKCNTWALLPSVSLRRTGPPFKPHPEGFQAFLTIPEHPQGTLPGASPLQAYLVSNVSEKRWTSKCFYFVLCYLFILFYDIPRF